MIDITWIDIVIPLMSALAIGMAMQKDNLSSQKWAPVVGLMVQPLWFYETITANQLGILVTTILFTLVYLNGFYQHWIKQEIDPGDLPCPAMTEGVWVRKKKPLNDDTIRPKAAPSPLRNRNQ